MAKAKSSSSGGASASFEGTVRNLLRMKPKPHKEKGKADDADDGKGDQAQRDLIAPAGRQTTASTCGAGDGGDVSPEPSCAPSAGSYTRTCAS